MCVNIVPAIKAMLVGPRLDTEERQLERVRRVVTGFSPGDRGLRRGCYVTSKDVERRRAALADHVF